MSNLRSNLKFWTLLEPCCQVVSREKYSKAKMWLTKLQLGFPDNNIMHITNQQIKLQEQRSRNPLGLHIYLAHRSTNITASERTEELHLILSSVPGTV